MSGPSPVDRRRVALSLSTALWPGAGQIYLGRRALGALLAVASLGLIALLCWDAVVAIVSAVPAEGSWTDLRPGAVWRALPGRTGWTVAGIVGVWAAGIADVVLRAGRSGA